MDPRYTTLWIVWLVMFFAIEGAAVFRRKSGDTLSEHMWSWFSIKQKGKGWMWRRGSLFFFLVWLLAHMMGLI